MRPISGLITGGLGLPAGMGILTYHFSLFGTKLTVSSGSGYSKVFQPGEIANFYKPVNPTTPQPIQPPFYVPVRITKQELITVEFTFGDKTILKEYAVSKQRLIAVVRIFKFVDVTRREIIGRLTSVNRVATEIKMSVGKIYKRLLNTKIRGKK